MYGTAATEKRQRGGRKAKKKKQQKQGDNQRQETDWDEIYDPSRPTNVDEYMRSDERIREVQEWKAVLYAHRRRRRGSSESDEDSDGDERPAMGSELIHEHPDGYNIANVAGTKQINSPRRETTPSHRRPCRPPGLHQVLPPQCRTTQQATMPTPGVWRCQVWVRRLRLLPKHLQLLRHHHHHHKTPRPSPALLSAMKPLLSHQHDSRETTMTTTTWT